MNYIEGSDGYLEDVMTSVIEWLESVRYIDAGTWGHWKYSSSMTRPYGLIPSIIAIRIFAVFDKLNDIPEKEKQDAVNYFQSQQDPSDGFFKDILVGEKELVENPRHAWPDIWGQMNAKDALELLDAKPLYPMPSNVFADLSSSDIRNELLSWDWEKRPWLVGERFHRALDAFCLKAENKVSSLIESAFRIVEEEIFSPGDGMPSKRGCKDINQLCGGIFKLLVTYKQFERPFPFPERAIDSILAMQKSNAEFADGGMCMNWDAVWVLWLMDKQLTGTYRHQDIADAANRLAAMLMREYRKSDGAFAFCGKVSLPVHHSVKIGESLAVSDMLGTLMCLYCLAYADDLNGKLNLKAHPHLEQLIFLRW